MQVSLGPVFLRDVAEPVRSRLVGEVALETALRDTVAAARAAWPDVALPAERFLSCLAHRVRGDGDALQGLRELNAVDLYAACACANGDARAIAAIEERCFRELETALRRLRFTAPEIEEVKQRLRSELFVPAPGVAAGITGYSGRGQLRRWLRVIAVRTARRLTRRERNEVAMDDHLTAVLPSPDENPALAHMKRHYRRAFRDAFGDAMRKLSDEDRELLRRHVIDGLGIDELGALYGVHRATAARWLSRARESIALGTRHALIARLGIAPAEYDSLMRLIQSRLEVSVRECLGAGAETE
jgi:RNA polymerase sigma-70 factor, ECF subfamily